MKIFIQTKKGKYEWNYKAFFKQLFGAIVKLLGVMAVVSMSFIISFEVWMWFLS